MPPPITAYDTCRRLFIGNLPPSCTRNDVIALVKNRTRATPAHVEIALVKTAPSSTSSKKTDLAGDDDDDDDDNDEKNAASSAPPPPPPVEVDSDGDEIIPSKKAKNKNAGASAATSAKKKEKKPLRDCRGFAHVTVEGLKSVMEQLQGATVQNNTVTVQQAKPHFMWKMDKAKREREREEEVKKEEALQKTQQPGYGELDQTSKPRLRPFEAGKHRFGNIAAEIAAKYRQRARERKARASGYSLPAAAAPPAAANARQRKFQQQKQQQQHQPAVAGKFAGRRRQREDEDGGKAKGGKAAAAAAAPAPPPPPPPKKEVAKKDKKLSALEQRLAALQAKLKGTSTS